MSDWKDFISNDATPDGRLLLLISQPDTFDAAQEHIYDVVSDTGISIPKHLFRPSRRRTKQPGERCAFISGGICRSFPI
jgi:hypothetical protein